VAETADDGSACEVVCFETATCLAGVCEPDPATVLICPIAAEPCLAAYGCDGSTGECTVPIFEAAGADCDVDEDLCTHDTCDGTGACGATGETEECATQNANNPCWTYTCAKKSGCAATLFVEGASCDDNNPCTYSDTCLISEGQELCTGEPLPIDDANPCTDDACVEGVVSHTAIDGIVCGGDSACFAQGLCVDGACEAPPAVDCDDGDPCTIDACDPETGGCITTPAEDATACDDEDPCTENDACSAGACAGTDLATCCGDGVCGESETCTCTDCPACSVGEPCAEADDCATGLCEAGVCAQAAGCAPIATDATGALGSLLLEGTISIDTATGDIVADGALLVDGDAEGVEFVPSPALGGVWSPPALRVYQVTDLHVAAGTTVTVTGHHGLAIQATGTILVEGLLDAAGTSGTAGSANMWGNAGSGGPGAWSGGQWQPLGCVQANGMATGPGAGEAGPCGGSGSGGGDGSLGGGGGGGGGSCGGTGGAGGGHYAAGGDGDAGDAGFDGTAGMPSTEAGSNGGDGGTACTSASGPSDGGVAFASAGPAPALLYGGVGGSTGGFGGFAGFGGDGGGDDGTGFGGDPGYSGGPGGGGGVVVLCGSDVTVGNAGEIDVRRGYGGPGAGPGVSTHGGQPPFFADEAAGGGGGGGGGSGGVLYASGGLVEVHGHLDAAGGGGASGGYNFGSGGIGLGGTNGGGQGGDGGSGGPGGAGGDGLVYLEGPGITMSGTYTGLLSLNP